MRDGREPRLGDRERKIRARAWRGKGGLHGEGKGCSKEVREGKQKKPS